MHEMEKNIFIIESKIFNITININQTTSKYIIFYNFLISFCNTIIKISFVKTNLINAWFFMDGKQKESSKYLPSFRIFPFEFDDEFGSLI